MPEAFYRCSFDVIKRSNGDSVVKKAAYNAREKIRQNESNLDIDYTTRQDLLAQAILAPKGAKEWVFDRYQHYNKVEEQDNRCNSQQGRTLDIGMLHQLTLDQNKQLLEQYLNKNFVSRGMIADYCIHDADPNGDRRNIHAHIILSMRRLDGDGFVKNKEREWNNKTMLQESRVAWAVEANMMFRSLGMNYYIDHRSLKEQGLDRLPQRHEGKQATNLKRRKGVKVSKASYNDLIQEFNQINQVAKELTANRELDRIKKIQQYDSLLQKTVALMEKFKQVQDAETAYWIWQRQLEVEEAEVEEKRIAKQYDPLWKKSESLAKLLNDGITATLIGDDDETNEEPKVAIEQDNQTTFNKAVNDNREPEKYQNWLEEAEAKAIAGRQKNQQQFNGRSEEDPPDDEAQRSARKRERWERTERSSTTGNLRSETIAENTDVEEAINRAEVVEKHYRNSQPSKVRNVITEYRVKLTNIIAKLDRREVVKDFRDIPAKLMKESA